MRVAIVGAGLSGLACAVELERCKVVPTIFDKKPREALSQYLNMCMFNGANKRIKNTLNYLKHTYNLHLDPVSPINKGIVQCNKTKVAFNINLGYLFRKGGESYSIQNQLKKRLSCTINFDKYINDIRGLKSTFDYVVVATGNNTFPRDLGISETVLKSYVKMATIVGNFELGVLRVWIDHAPEKRYEAYMIAHEKNQAVLTFIIKSVTYDEVEIYWNKFISKNRLDHEIITNNETNIKIVSTETSNFNISKIKTPKIGNTYFIGNSGGFVNSFLGYGMINCIESGIFAAQSILMGQDYSELIGIIVNRTERFRIDGTSWLKIPGIVIRGEKTE